MHRLPREAYNSFHGNIAPVSGPDAVFLSFSLSLSSSPFSFTSSFTSAFSSSSTGPIALRLSPADSLPAINPSATIRGSNCIINCVCPCTSRIAQRVAPARCRVESALPERWAAKAIGNRRDHPVKRGKRPSFSTEKYQFQKDNGESRRLGYI